MSFKLHIPVYLEFGASGVFEFTGTTVKELVVVPVIRILSTVRSSYGERVSDTRRMSLDKSLFQGLLTYLARFSIVSTLLLCTDVYGCYSCIL